MNKIKEILANQWDWLKSTIVGKLTYSFALVILCFSLANIWDFMFYVAWVFMLYPLGVFFVMLAYAWVINPIKDLKASKNKK